MDSRGDVVCRLGGILYNHKNESTNKIQILRIMFLQEEKFYSSYPCSTQHENCVTGKLFPHDMNVRSLSHTKKGINMLR